MFQFLKIFIINLVLMISICANGESLKKPSFDLEGISEKLTSVSDYVKKKKEQEQKIAGFQVRFGNLVTHFATNEVGHHELANIRKELEDIEKDVREIDQQIVLHQESLRDLKVALEVNLRSITQLKKNGSKRERRDLLPRRNKAKRALENIEKYEGSLTKQKELTNNFLSEVTKWKESLTSKAQKGIDKKNVKWEIAELISNPIQIVRLIKKDIEKIVQGNEKAQIEKFIADNRVKIFLRIFISLVLIIFFIKIDRVVRASILLKKEENITPNLMNDVISLMLSQRVLFVLSSIYLLTQQRLGVLSYATLPTLLDFIFTAMLSIIFWHYFYSFVVLPRIQEVNERKGTRFSFPKVSLYIYIVLRVFSSSFVIENILLDILSNLFLVFISYKFFWLSVQFKITESDAKTRYYSIFAKSSKFLVMFFSSILFVSCFLNLFGSFSLGSTVQSVVFSNLILFIASWFVYQLLLINLDQFISKIDKGNLQFRKRIIDVLIFVRNYSNILLFSGFSYFVLDSWFDKLFVFSSFSSIAIFKMGDYAFTIDRPFYIIWVIFCVRVIHLTLLWSIDSYFLKRFKISRRHSANVYSITRYIFFVVYFLVISAVLGVTYKNLLIFASALGVGIGFGLQNIVNNFLSGIILLFEQPIRVGDLIDVEGQLCHVKHLGIRSTIVQTMDNSSVIIPNSELLSNKVTNWTLHDSDVALKCEVGVAYGTDTKKVSEILMSIGVANNQVLQFPEPQVWFSEFGESSLNFVLKVWIDKPANKFLIKTELMHEINRLIAENNIVIPFPQRDLHLKTD